MSTNELRQSFDYFDRDHNGTIDFAEFGELLKALNSDMDEESRRMGFDIIDSDHSGTIDYDEFVTWWQDQE
jgi:calmodulin